MTSRPVQFNEFVLIRGPRAVPASPFVDVHAVLDVTDFHWTVDYTNVTSRHYVVCQFRTSSSYTLTQN